MYALLPSVNDQMKGDEKGGIYGTFGRRKEHI
jgi:hypothetical protein